MIVGKVVGSVVSTRKSDKLLGSKFMIVQPIAAMSGVNSQLVAVDNVGAGGAGFPTYMKLNHKAEIVLLNCAECEPLLKLHQQLLETHTAEILRTLEEVANTLGAKQVFVCAKSEYKRTTQGCLTAVNPLITAVNSILLFLVSYFLA